MEENLKVYNLMKSVPNEAQKQITGGRLAGMTDIKPMWRIEKLTEIFGPCGLGWYTKTLSKEIIDGANQEKIATVDIHLFVNYKKPLGLDEDLWSAPIEGSGGSSFIANEKNGLYTSDECFKMAYTDALSVACKSLGMGADVYWGDSKYSRKPAIETLEQAKEYVLTFGKYQGKKLTEVSGDYVEWLRKNSKDRNVLKAIELLFAKDVTPYDFMNDEEKIKSQKIDETRKQQIIGKLTQNEIKAKLVRYKRSKLSDLTLGEAFEILEEKEKQLDRQVKERKEVF